MKNSVSLNSRQKEFIFEKPTKFKPVNREDIHGADYLLNQIEPYVKLVSMFDSSRSDSTLMRGIIFYGPAGTGKTYLARYFATVAQARFIDAREFPREGPEGSWTKNDVQKLWQFLRDYAAKKQKPIVVFWDQFDEFVTSASDGAFNQFNVELDGLTGRPNGIVIIAATTSDPALFDSQLTRPGRLSIHVQFDYPTRQGCASILRYFFQQKFHVDFDLESLTYLLGPTTPSAIKEFVELAYEKAQLRSRIEKTEAKITKEDLVSVLVDDLIGKPDAMSAERSEEIILNIAVHEVGHALVGWTLGWPVALVGIISSQGAGGQTIFVPQLDDSIASLEDAHIKLAISFGGLAATELIGCKKDFGAIFDIESATGNAYLLVCNFGEGAKTRERFGLAAVNYKEGSEDLKKSVESDSALILIQAEESARKILNKLGKEKILIFAENLVQKSVLLRNEFEEIARQQQIEIGFFKNITD